MRTIINAYKIFTPEEVLIDHTIVVEGAKIITLTEHQISPQSNDIIIDAKNYLVTPGLIDIHVHGAMGADTMDASPEALEKMGDFFARHGVTSFLPTTMAETPDRILKAIQNIAQVIKTGDQPSILGAHIEGPYFAPAYKGAQPEYNLRDANPIEYKKWIETGIVKLVSIAPERRGALDFINYGIRRGIEFSIGHTGASYEQVIEAANHGARQATHTFNGMLGLHHRKPGTVGGVLTDKRIYAQVIADGIHIHPAIVAMIIRVKGIRRTILITDAIRATGLEDGQYELGGEPINVNNSIPRTLSGALAGSTLTLDSAIKNVMEFSGLSFNQVLPMATSTPAEAMGWQSHKGYLKPGADADITIFDPFYNVQATIVAGKLVYRK